MQKILNYVRNNVKKLKKFHPIVITDIDGVLMRGKIPIPGTIQAINQLKSNKIPFACLTNGGGQLESFKVDKMNYLFGQKLFEPQFMFMNHTPLKPQLVKYSKKDGILLVSGSVNVKSIIQDLKIKNYVTADQLYALFHKNDQVKQSQSSLSYFSRNINTQATQKIISQRLKVKQLPTNYHEWGQIINSIFSLNDISPYETTLEVIHNVFLQKQKRNVPLPPYFASQNDIVWAGGYHRPRIAFGPFNYMLQQHCAHYGFPLNKCYYGKPQKVAFEFVQKQMTIKFGQGCFFMIGDNPRADIRGANNVEWASFLTQTGVHHGQANDVENPATMVVHNFREAIDVIMKIKRQALYQ